MCKVIDFKSEVLNKTVKEILKRNNNNGYHLMVSVINTMKSLGKSELEIAEALKESF